MFPPFPFVPFSIPPPQPPPNFSGMSEAELREMEGTERSNVEARIKCLRNIQVPILNFKRKRRDTPTLDNVLYDSGLNNVLLND